MKKLNIFIETGNSGNNKVAPKYTNEYYFVRQYLHHILPGITEDDYKIISVGGKDKLRMYDNEMKQNTDNGETNLVIFDCDEQSCGGGIKNRNENFDSIKKELSIDFAFFLFPNNNDEGCFEDLLLNIINPEHSGLIDCFNGYEMCIGSKDPEGEKYKTPNKKAKIYAYITSFKCSRKQNESIKNGNWEFNNSKFWNLDTEYLNPLKDFILSHVKE